METGFLNSLLARQPVVLGRKLRPFSIGHALILQAIHHPLVTGRELTAGDCLSAVVILEGTFEQGREVIQDFAVEMLDASEACGEFDAAEVSAILREYYLLSINVPEIIVDQFDKSPNYPVELALLVGLMRLGLSESAALEMPYNRAFWYCIAANSKEIVSERVASMFNNLKELEAQLRAEWIADDSPEARWTKAQKVPAGRN